LEKDLDKLASSYPLGRKLQYANLKTAVRDPKLKNREWQQKMIE